MSILCLRGCREDKEIPWVRGRGVLILHKWYIGFDPIKENPKRKYIWVKLLGLPLEFWSKREIFEIAKRLGGCIMWMKPA